MAGVGLVRDLCLAETVGETRPVTCSRAAACRRAVGRRRRVRRAVDAPGREPATTAARTATRRRRSSGRVPPARTRRRPRPAVDSEDDQRPDERDREHERHDQGKTEQDVREAAPAGARDRTVRGVELRPPEPRKSRSLEQPPRHAPAPSRGVDHHRRHLVSTVGTAAPSNKPTARKSAVSFTRFRDRRCRKGGRGGASERSYCAGAVAPGHPIEEDSQ